MYLKVLPVSMCCYSLSPCRTFTRFLFCFQQKRAIFGNIHVRSVSVYSHYKALLVSRTNNSQCPKRGPPDD